MPTEHWLIDEEGNILHEQMMSAGEARNRNLELESVGAKARWEDQQIHKPVPLPPFSEVLRRVLAVQR